MITYSRLLVSALSIPGGHGKGPVLTFARASGWEGADFNQLLRLAELETLKNVVISGTTESSSAVGA
jgi:hypothetical protein